MADEGVLPVAAAPPADLLGTMEGLKRAPPFSIRDDIVRKPPYRRAPPLSENNSCE